MARELLEELGSLAVLCQGEEHAGGGVQARGPGRKYGGEDDGVHDARCPQDSGLGEDQGEGADGDVGLRGGQQVRVGVGNEEADHRDGADVEQQDAPEDRPDGARDRGLRVLGLSRRGADELGALEGVSGYEQDDEDALRPSHKGCCAVGPGRRAGRVPDDAGDHEHAQHEEDDDSSDLDRREPELALTVGACGQGVEDEEHEQEER
ncbi:MAG: hypothetical protein Q605_AUC00912G0003 [Actinomyces urogenitalis DORA_12]|uniref:Uncharacterized protein n=1 Tax=Actinomyces urogenitalis DORA_12 TaxID=1403939 RepID=W1VAE4_9ACTO|nr:MAG: hypothetical protein Q605_AUC00912G0003 [Actinomyces urogenitalis DORA_12]